MTGELLILIWFVGLFPGLGVVLAMHDDNELVDTGAILFVILWPATLALICFLGPLVILGWAANKLTRWALGKL